MWRGLRRSGWPLVASAASELDAAKQDAERETASLEQRPCPALGDRNYVRGRTDAQQLVSAAERGVPTWMARFSSSSRSHVIRSWRRNSAFHCRRWRAGRSRRRCRIGRHCRWRSRCWRARSSNRESRIPPVCWKVHRRRLPWAGSAITARWRPTLWAWCVDRSVHWKSARRASTRRSSSSISRSSMRRSRVRRRLRS